MTKKQLTLLCSIFSLIYCLEILCGLSIYLEPTFMLFISLLSILLFSPPKSEKIKKPAMKGRFFSNNLGKEVNL